MSEIRVNFRMDGEALLKKDPGTGRLLRQVAEKVEARVKVPSGYTTTVKAGVGRHGAFSQVILHGPRAIFLEFGTKTTKALAPIRAAVFGKGVKVGR